MRRRRFRHLPPALWLGMAVEAAGLLAVTIYAKRQQRRAIVRGIDGIYVDGKQVAEAVRRHSGGTATA